MAGEDTNIKAFPMGAVIIQEGPASPKEMILVLQGNIGVFKNYRMATQQQLGVISNGSFHGELSLFQGRDQEQTLVALTKVVVLTISKSNCKQFFANQPDMAVTIVEGICKKLAKAGDELFLLKGDDSAEPSRRSALFPENHGSYTLPLSNQSDNLYIDKVKCPLCGHAFDGFGIIQSKLRLDRTDPDLRQHYKGFEPLYYELTTCPNCFFSATTSQFGDASKRSADEINQRVGPYKLEMYIRTGLERDTFTVFAGYYLALLCAPVIADNHQLTTGNLWIKISRLYRDCEDEAMALYASRQALEDYRYAYEHLKIGEKQSQQLCYALGDLYYKTGDMDNARTFFFAAKANKEGTPVLARQADQRLEEIREMKQAATAAK